MGFACLQTDDVFLLYFTPGNSLLAPSVHTEIKHSLPKVDKRGETEK